MKTTIYVKCKGYDCYCKCAAEIKKSNKNYHNIHLTEIEGMSKYAYYNTPKERRFILPGYELKDAFIHEIGHAAMVERIASLVANDKLNIVAAW